MLKCFRGSLRRALFTSYLLWQSFFLLCIKLRLFSVSARAECAHRSMSRRWAAAKEKPPCCFCLFKLCLSGKNLNKSAAPRFAFLRFRPHSMFWQKKKTAQLQKSRLFFQPSFILLPPHCFVIPSSASITHAWNSRRKKENLVKKYFPRQRFFSLHSQF